MVHRSADISVRVFLLPGYARNGGEWFWHGKAVAGCGWAGIGRCRRIRMRFGLPEEPGTIIMADIMNADIGFSL